MTGRHVLAIATVASLSLVTGVHHASAQANLEVAELFSSACADCHSAAQAGRTPGRASLASLSPRAIVASLTDGVMSGEGEDLTDEQRILLAEYLSRRTFSRELLPESAYCSDRGPAPLEVSAVGWMGFGGDLEGTGFQSAERGRPRRVRRPEPRAAVGVRLPGSVPDAHQAHRNR